MERQQARSRSSRRLRGTAPAEDGKEYLELEEAALRQVRHLVDVQATYAQKEGSYMVALGLGDASSWGFSPTEDPYHASLPRG